ncbi:MAG TPA: hypothetical protein PLN33_00990 [Hyphomonadaceae bacterium]|nr:hypothetical protein [Hyphomonadaceae bacterium]HPN04465.1 hypothetical protein [Hyphomonadaceae bacterium]
MTIQIEAVPLPDNALLARYRDMPGGRWDCYAAVVAGQVSAEAYIAAFYTTGLFKCERFVLFLIGRGCTDADARALAAGKADKFAAWTVEARGENQLLVCDFLGSTRSWLMTAPAEGSAGTRLYFGSAVVPRAKDRAGNPRTSAVFALLQPVHAFYARALLRAAARKLSRQAP